MFVMPIIVDFEVNQWLLIIERIISGFLSYTISLITRNIRVQ